MDPNASAYASPAFQSLVRKMIKDMRFVGIFTIIQGGLACLGIVTALIGIPQIIMGLRLRESADQFENYLSIGDMSTLYQALERQSKYFYINKILIIIAIVFVVLYIIVIIFVVGAGIFTGLNEAGY